MLLSAALPVWQQSQLILPDGQRDPQWFNDCGETCLGMCLAATRGTPVSPASIRASLGGPNRSGITSGADLVQMAAYYGVPAHVESVPALQLQTWLNSWTAANKPSIVLGTWPTPGKVLHWMLTTSTFGLWNYINPWSGARSWLFWPTTERLYGGYLVAIDEPVGHDAHTLTVPY